MVVTKTQPVLRLPTLHTAALRTQPYFPPQGNYPYLPSSPPLWELEAALPEDSQVTDENRAQFCSRWLCNTKPYRAWLARSLLFLWTEAGDG